MSRVRDSPLAFSIANTRAPSGRGCLLSAYYSAPVTAVAARISFMRSESPIVRTHNPKTIMRSERNAAGRPEKGVTIINTPKRMRVLVRDILAVYQGSTITTNSPRTAPGCSAKCDCISATVPETSSSCTFVSSRAITMCDTWCCSSSSSNFKIRCGDS